MSKDLQVKNALNIRNVGLVLDSPITLSNLPDFEILFGGEGAGTTPDWEKYLPPFRYQGASMWCTAFAGTALASIFNKREDGSEKIFSAIELFYRSGGQWNGNSILSTLYAMRDGLVFEQDLPTPIPDAWGQTVYERYKRVATATTDARERGKPYAIKEPINVSPTNAMMREALKKSPLDIAIGIGSGYFNDVAPNPTKVTAYHSLLLLRIESDGTRVVFDSLTYKQGFSGIHRLAADYEILYAIGAVDLPNDWYEIQQDHKNQNFDFALNHYGLKRLFTLELERANQFRVILRDHPTLLALAGKYWTVIVNALVYGGYTFTDILNHLTNIRRTGNPIFNLNEVRSK